MNPNPLRKTMLLRPHLLALGLALLTWTAQAETKIAVINLKTVFEGYWKTKQSDATVKDRQGEFEKERKKLLEDYQKANEDYRNLRTGANDAAVSADEREKRKKTADAKLLEIKEMEQSTTSFERQFGMQIQEQIKRMRENILREIREVVNDKAKRGQLSLVVDTAAQSINQTPVILFSTDLPDLTDEVLTELNAKAPPGALTPGDAAAEKKDEKTEDKK